MQREVANQILRFSQEFGLSFASRMNVATEPL